MVDSNKNMLMVEAIKRLRPGIDFGLIGETLEGLTWHSDTTPPTIEEIEALIPTIQNEINNNKYKQDRKKEYPSIGEQLDALFHAGVFPEEMAAKIQAIKDKYPKPEN